MCTAIVLQLHSKDSVVPMPWWMEVVIFKAIGKIVFFKPNVHIESVGKRKRNSTSNKETVDNETSGLNDLRISWTGQPNHSQTNGRSNKKVIGHHKVRSSSESMTSCMEADSVGSNDILLGLTQSVLFELRKITKKLKETGEENELQSKWKESAQILDRFFLFIFLISEIALAIYFFGRI